jgi:hypothetical protein
MRQLFLERLREIFRLKGKIPYVHTMDLYVNLLLDHFYTLCISSLCIAMLVQNFALKQKIKKFMSHIPCFLGKFLPNFEKFENFL